jgi:hypothetical protein
MEAYSRPIDYHEINLHKSIGLKLNTSVLEGEHDSSGLDDLDT